LWLHICCGGDIVCKLVFVHLFVSFLVTPTHKADVCEPAVKRRRTSEVLSGLLEEDVSSGKISCTTAQQYSSALGDPVGPGDDLHKLAKLGSMGRHLQNGERDFHRLMRRSGKSLKVELEYIKIRLFNPTTCLIEEKLHPILPPSSLVRALFKEHGDIFEKLMLGGEDAESYWSHVAENTPWFKRHAAYQLPCRKRLVPFHFYGDDVKCFHNADGKILVIAIAPELSSLSSMLRYWPVLVLPLHHVCWGLVS
jgi:hypothetical protein